LEVKPAPRLKRRGFWEIVVTFTILDLKTETLKGTLGKKYHRHGKNQVIDERSAISIL